VGAAAAHQSRQQISRGVSKQLNKYRTIISNSAAVRTWRRFGFGLSTAVFTGGR
jgi:hypothetical protein